MTLSSNAMSAAGSVPLFQPLDGIMLAEHSHRVTNDILDAVSLLEVCRSHARDAQVGRSLDDVIERLHGAGELQRVLSRPQSPEVNLAATMYDLTVAIERHQRKGSLLQLSFHLEPIATNADVAWRVATVMAEIISKVLRRCSNGRGGTVGLSLKLENEGIVCRVEHGAHDFDGIGTPTCELGCEVLDDVVTSLGGHLGRTLTPTSETVTLWLPHSWPDGRTCSDDRP